MAGTPYYEAGSAGEKIQANLVFSLAIQKGKMAPSWPLGISRNGPARRKSYLGHIIIFESIIYWPSLFSQDG